MARKAMVTRRFVQTECTLEVYDPVSKTVTTKNVTVHGRLTGTKLEKTAQRVIAPLRLLEITSAETTSKLYGIYETEFVRLAMELDEKTRKPLGEPDAGNEENNTEKEED